MKQKYASIIPTRDIQKAFDTVWHNGLLYKLHTYIDNTNLFTGIIDYYLKNRNVTPLFKGKKGTLIKPEAGVPQGSVIGPILFIIFVNDLPPPIYHDTIRTQFADDVITLTRSYTKRKNKLM